MMSRSLIFLFDGTSNDPTVAYNAPTNVFWFNSLIADSAAEYKSEPQITFYLPGIGSKFYAESIFGKLKQMLLGIGTEAMLMRAYLNLISNYRPGDRISAIGFSRGAIAARLFVRLILDFGILRSNSIQLFEAQLEKFGKAIEENYTDFVNQAAIFRSDFKNVLHDQADFKFLGLFDCVYGPHDEDFINFLTEVDDNCSGDIESYVHLMSIDDIRGHFVLGRLKSHDDIGREIWTPGVHSDVGGGYELDEIAKVSRLTMAYYAEDAGISLDPDQLSGLEDEVKGINKFNINKDRSMFSEFSRDEYVSANDSVHALYGYLAGNQVSWKGEKDIYTRKEGIVNLQKDRISKRVVSMLNREHFGA